jgi:serine/threonine protein kinase
LRVLGSGAQATVYLARKINDDQDRLYAVKVFKKESDMAAEIKNVLELRHENILPVLEANA